ncbi:GntR family transcriptional regulator [Kitasatospora sp. NBC_00240]|uniref:GntR family transcriptional regulator n=1 Tax=Kitasatospora sp. NBC_00240 TaxID=2903567 RepID=UPI002B1D84FA|nr:GntR family transcriptional regulator [Kitasatospora sp. NBC_00240]
MPDPDAGESRSAIHRNSLREQIAGALREEMMAGRLAAGRNFTVREIAELYGVSATPAREALVDLAAQGLLRTEHHRGFTVPEFGWDDFVEIFETRTLLTDSAIRRLSGWAALPDAARLPSLRRRADAAARAARAGQLDVMVGCDRRFWQEAGALLGNRRIADYLDWLRVQSWMFAAPYLRAIPDLAGVCWDGHHGFVDAVEAGDVAAARRVVGEYNLLTVRLMAELTGHDPERLVVLPLLVEAVAPQLPGAAAPRPAVPPAAQPGARSAGRSGGAAGRPGERSEDQAALQSAGPAAGGRTVGPGRLFDLSRDIGLGLVPQPRSIPFSRFGPALPPSEPDSRRTPGR